MIEEAIDRIKELADEARSPESLEIPGDRKSRVHVAMPGGELKIIEIEPGARTIQMQSIKELCQLATDHFDKRPNFADKMLITYNDSKVQLIFNTENGRERAHVALHSTEEMRFFGSITNGKTFDVKELRGILRYILAKTYTNTELVKQVSSLRVDTKGHRGSEAGRANESMSEAVERQVNESIQLPDENQTFNVRRWSNSELMQRFSINCILDPDVESNRWYLQPLEESYNAFCDDNLDLLGRLIKSNLEDSGNADTAAIPVIRGTFSVA